MSFDLSQYSTVAERIDAFTKEYPNFGMTSYVQDVTIDGVAFIRVQVKIFRDAFVSDPTSWATGWAQERATKAFALESAETSAYGRALANANYAAKLGTPRPSREEMRTVPESNSDLWATVPSTQTAEDWDKPYVPFDEPPPRPHCSHGPMLSQGGVSASGKKLPLWKCSEVDRDSQCKAIWA